MEKDPLQKDIEENLNEGDSLIGFFLATNYPFTYWLALLTGQPAALQKKEYCLAVTEKGISFYQLNRQWKFKKHQFYEFGEFESVKIGKGILERSMVFVLKNNKKIKVDAKLYGADPAIILQSHVQQYIESNIPLA